MPSPTPKRLHWHGGSAASSPPICTAGLALVRLSLTAGPAASWRYAAEEVGTVMEAPAVMEHLVRVVPLVNRLDDGRYRAHDLWASLVSTDHLRHKAVEVLTKRGDLAAAHHLADRALELEPFEPRGHRLALAAALRTESTKDRGDPVRACWTRCGSSG
ncbi:hypothetical protein [Lentzea sp. E54]|uniref:hypothetical protein n=1 Tax=Lentzea xerophila TaxID=3435883 RepID=UPI003DA26E48